MEIFVGQTDTPEAVGTPSARNTFDQVCTRGATVTFDAVLATNQRFAIAAVRTVRAIQTTYTIMTANESIRVIAERTVVAAFAPSAGNTPRVGRALTQLSHQITESRIELSRSQILHGAAHSGNSRLGPNHAAQIGCRLTGCGILTHFFKAAQTL